jgi:hypothetical protein
MEPVEQDGGDIDDSVRELYHPPGQVDEDAGP